MEQFIDKWQTLIGSALGAVLAITGSVFLYIVKSIYEETQDWQVPQILDTEFHLDE